MIKLKKNFEYILIFILFCCLIFILGFNILHYDPIFGYDGEAHHEYVQNFLSLYPPWENDFLSNVYTYEFFSPPLPYVFPAFINEVCKRYITFENGDIYNNCRIFYGFINMIFNSILFITLLLIYQKITNLLFKKSSYINLTTVLVMILFTVNYRTILMLRGEMYILLLNSLMLYQFIKIYKNNFRFSYKDIYKFGFIIGGLALSRQWAFLLFPAYFLLTFFINNKEERLRYIKFISKSFVIGFFLSSWFYFDLYLNYGTFTAFNKDSIKFSLSNQPSYFYNPFNKEALIMFSKPIRGYFVNQFLPILYSDLWGDYWGYFSFTSRDLVSGRNQLNIGSYLARVNVVSLIPTFLLIFGFIKSLKYFKKSNNQENSLFFKLLILCTVSSFFGYLIFLIKYAEPTGDTIKATYIIQLFHLLGILLINYLENLKEIKPNFYFLFVLIYIVIFINNFSAMTSHFPYQNIFKLGS